ncbi:MAG: tetratricopeptide repeat protein [Chroococcidiopsidaceae cyanobacterium CP_BM_ER_R8_30]|nr:tetratricopeptide repeat protein [Chroococcidiopsidaceae cyanobacterium CP_BM_ER_R8_30]
MMKLVYGVVATLGTVSVLGGITQAVQAQPALNRSPQLIAQVNTLNGSPLPAGGGISSGSFTYPGGGSFYRGNLNSEGNGNYQGSLYPQRGGISQGTFYYPNSGGNFHGLFYNPGSGKIIQGNFYNPGSGSINQGTAYAPLQGNPYYYPTPSDVYPGYYGYDPRLRCYNQADLHDWGVGCFSQRDYKQAIEYYTQAIKKNPKLINAYNRRALARFILGDKPGTIADLRKAASLYLDRGDKGAYQQTLETIREVQADKQIGSTTSTNR